MGYPTRSSRKGSHMRIFSKRVRFGVLTGAIGLFTLCLTGQSASADSSVTARAGTPWFYVKSAVVEKCSDVNGKSTSPHALVISFDCRGTNNQLWTFVRDGAGTFDIINRGSGLCLDVFSNFPAVNGDLLQQFPCGPDTAKWEFRAVGGDVVRIVDGTSGRCLSFPDTFDNGARLEMWDCIPDDFYQLWVQRFVTSG